MQPISSVSNCVICIGDLSTAKVKKLSCEHNFHEICINTWLKSNNTCPICRKVTHIKPLEKKPEPTIAEILLAIPDIEDELLRMHNVRRPTDVPRPAVRIPSEARNLYDPLQATPDEVREQEVLLQLYRLNVRRNLQ